jgi:hypothetical protein
MGCGALLSPEMAKHRSRGKIALRNLAAGVLLLGAGCGDVAKASSSFHCVQGDLGAISF